MEIELIELLKSLKMTDEKICEVSKKQAIVENIKLVSKNTFNKMQYTLACTAPKDAPIEIISDMIENGTIQHESILRGILNLKVINKQKYEIEETYKKFISENFKSKDEIEKLVSEKMNENLEKHVILKEVKKEMPFIDFKIVMEILEEYSPIEKNITNSRDENKWLESGVIAKLKRPEENTQATEEILKEHLKRTGGMVITRFPPEPSGCLHIGHAKAMNLSFEYAKKLGGKTYLRFDDTNPRNEKEEHFYSIQEDIKWLGFEPCAVTASSDHIETMIEFSKKLIKSGKAYVCELENEEVRNRRQKFQKMRDAELEESRGKVDYELLGTILSPYRNAKAEENLEKFEKMLKGEYGEGEATLRFRMPLESKNPLMLDLVGARVINMIHPFKHKNYIVYPSYEFALCVCDSLEDITHSFCSREFYTRQEPYHWLLRELNLYEPIQWEFSRLNISNAILSKRKFNEIVKKGLNWDDPRFFTIKGMRRRGFPADAINKFARSVGITFSETIVDVKILESFVEKELFKTAKKIHCILKPLKINVGIKKTIKLEDVDAIINKVLYIDQSDFSDSGDSNFLRLTPTNPVGLIGVGALKFISSYKGSNGLEYLNCEIIEESNPEYVKPKKFIQWIPNLDIKVELRMYSSLFKSFNPEEVGYLKDMNIEDSLKVIDGFCDGRILKAKKEDKFQFLRIGFFCCDFDSVIEENRFVFNLTLELKKAY